MTDLEIIILAAGKGSRMNANRPKVLTEIKGKPMLSYLLNTIKEISKKPIIVLGYKADEVKKEIGSDYNYVIQSEQLGTGHAVHQAVPLLSPTSKHVIVLYGDHPLINTETIISLYKSHSKQKKSPVTLGTVLVPDYSDWRKPFYDFGRVVRDSKGMIMKIVEKKDSSETELKIMEISPSYFCFNTDWLVDNIKNIGTKNAQGEYYLTDLIGMAKGQGFELNSITINTHEALGVNTPEQLEFASQFIK